MDESNSQRLVLVDRSLSTTPPSASIPAGFCALVNPPIVGPMVLTPPASPAQARHSSDQSPGDETSHSTLAQLQTKDAHQRIADAPGFSLPPTRDQTYTVCPFDVRILNDRHGANEVFGSGAWSTVYKAIRQSAPSSFGLTTPPSSPVVANPSLLAVKVPMRKDAEPILEHEGEILTYLSSFAASEKSIAPFFGVIPKFSSLVLAAIPLSLEEHITSCAKRAKQTLTTRNMSDPVVGTTKAWVDLAKKVISALHWLHDETGVVHGDVKPGNILLKPASAAMDTSQFPFQPVLIDFSSGHILNSNKSAPNMLSAVTREYTAPELLSSTVFREPKSCTTPGSDVFATAVTLLVAAIGDHKVYPGSVHQRQAMATQGWQVLQLVRSGDNGSRVPRHGVVERALERAVLKAGMGRVNAGQWLDVIEEMSMGEPSKMS